MAPTPTTVGSTSASQYFTYDSLDIKGLEDFQKILDAGDVDLTNFREEMSYLGFDKQRIARLAALNLGPRRTIKCLYLGAMRGTNLEKILSKSVKVDQELKTAFDTKKILSGGTGANDLTMGRLMGTFPEIAAYYAIKYPFPKKIEDSDCPSALQWPTAASLPMSLNVRLSHVRFCVEFSALIGSKFEQRYYLAAFNSQLSIARLDPSVLSLCGASSDAESRAVDMSMVFQDAMPGGVRVGKQRVTPLSFVPPQVGPT